MQQDGLTHANPNSAFARFEGFLRAGGMSRPDAGVMVRLQTQFPEHILACGSAEAAVQVYYKAGNLPGTATCAELAERTGIRLNMRAMLPQSHAGAALVHAWKDGTPKLLKIPRLKEDAVKETNVWKSLPACRFILGPMELVELHGGKCGVLMPLLPWTLARVPRPMPEANVLRVCQELRTALELFHACGLGHNDVKPSNVLLATDGTCSLCDFGSSESVGQAVRTSTELFVPVGITSTTGPRYDFAMLAMTALFLLALFPGTGPVGLWAAQLWAAGVAHGGLRELLLEMLGDG